MRHMSKLMGSAATALIVASLIASPAIAQNSGNGGGSDEVGNNFNEIIVTANKRAESVQDVSASITAITASDLAVAGVSNIDKLELLTPGLLLGRTGVDAIPAIRGARTGQVEHNDTTISFYTDGIVQPRHGQAIAGFFDIDRVEVLRGPQGTLFGRNTLGGAISAITKKPKLGDLDVGGSVDIGNYALRSFQGFLNVPLGDKLALRISGSREVQNPIVKNLTIGDDGGFKDADNYFIRAQLYAEPSDDLSIRLKYERWEDNSNGPGDYGFRVLGIPVNPATGRTNPFIASSVMAPSIGRSSLCLVGCGRFGGGGAAPDTAFRALPVDQYGPYVTSGDFKPFLNIRQDAFMGEVTYEGLSFADLKLIGSYTNYYERRFVDGDFTPFPSLVEGVLTTSKSASEELQFVSKDNGSPFKWVVGAYFFQEDLGGSFQQQQLYVVDANNTPDRTQPLNAWANPTNRIDIYTRSYAGYAQGTYSLSETFRVLAGVRYTQDNRLWDIYGQTRTQQALTYSNPVLLGTRKNWNRTTWKGGLEYDLGPDAMGYFTVSTGYLAGNAQGQYSGAATYDAQTATAYELGLKSTFADGKIRFNVAAYYNQYRNLLSIRFVDTATTTLAQTTNAGAVNSKGVEVEADWVPNDYLRLGARLSFMHARFGDFVFNRRYQEGGNIRPNASGQFTAWQLEGLQVANSPDFTGTVFASYRFDLGDKGSLTPMVSTYINSGYRTSDDPLLFGEQGSFQKTDLSLTWTSSDEKTTVRGWVRNVENEATLTRGTRFGGDLAVVDYAAPRTYGLTISYNF